MRTQIKRIPIMQTSKVVAIIYPIFGLIHTMIGIWMLTSREQPNWLGILFILIPIIIGIFGFVVSVIGCWLIILQPVKLLVESSFWKMQNLNNISDLCQIRCSSSIYALPTSTQRRIQPAKQDYRRDFFGLYQIGNQILKD